ncbi:HSP20-like chaperone [Chlorella sorokiniana]|uniref:HSP20-like chaperone n=1 Tax=Chlorella sorokiniana TaxID=3076 RepID=A0A2P6U5C6_CHLSO|nr:HSP20-like chaperone [Chlorella sorokiniana]|eukprot:PRW61524.1 HSP20-like chaperone [Chlorella sorokiniana]
MPLQPTVLWAQRADRLLLTIDLQSCKDPQISITNDEAAKAGRVTFRGHAHSHATGPDEHAYQLDLELYGEVDDKDIKQLTTDRYITLAIAKKGPQEHWPRLLKAAGKPAPNIKVDWDKWVDEDEEEEGEDKMGGFDLSQLQNFANFGGGPGGMDFSGGDLSDDEEEGKGEKAAESDDDLPELEPVPQQ